MFSGSGTGKTVSFKTSRRYIQKMEKQKRYE
jgi:hypothetical protein